MAIVTGPCSKTAVWHCVFRYKDRPSVWVWQYSKFGASRRNEPRLNPKVIAPRYHHRGVNWVSWDIRWPDRAPGRKSSPYQAIRNHKPQALGPYCPIDANLDLHLRLWRQCCHGDSWIWQRLKRVPDNHRLYKRIDSSKVVKFKHSLPIHG